MLQELALALAAAASLLAVALAAVTAGAAVLTVNVTNDTVYVELQNLTFVDFGTTMLRAGYINSTHIVVAYVCQYQVNVSECAPLNVTVYNETKPVYNVNFTNPASMLFVEGLVAGGAKVNVTGFGRIVVKAVDVATNASKTIVLPGPVGVQRFEYMGLLGPLVTIGLLVGFAARGSALAAGIGLFIFGVLVLVIQSLGLPPPPNQLLVSTFAILTGILLIWFSRQG